MKKQIEGTLCLLLATIVWGSAFVAQSVGMEHIGPFTFQAVRCALAVIGLIPVIAIADKLRGNGRGFLARWRNKKLWTAGVLCGIPLFLACNLQQIGLVDTDAGKSAFLTTMYIVIVPIIGIFLKKKPSKMVPVSVALAVVGLYFLSCVGVTSIRLSDLLLLGCALMFAVQIVLVDLLAPGLDGLRLNVIQVMICAVLSGIVMLLTEKPTLNAIGQSWLPLGYAGFLSMGAGYSLQIIGQQKLPPTTASLIMSLESVFAVLAGWILLSQRLTLWEGLGCVLMFAAVILSQIPDKTLKVR